MEGLFVGGDVVAMKASRSLGFEVNQYFGASFDPHRPVSADWTVEGSPRPEGNFASDPVKRNSVECCHARLVDRWNVVSADRKVHVVSRRRADVIDASGLDVDRCNSSLNIHLGNRQLVELPLQVCILCFHRSCRLLCELSAVLKNAEGGCIHGLLRIFICAAVRYLHFDGLDELDVEGMNLYPIANDSSLHRETLGVFAFELEHFDCNHIVGLDSSRGNLSQAHIAENKHHMRVP
mmetsp:Transcript_20462/g.68335  ORF Transcript_20462/g.68335 Transcript_20462/m.68335 type:complete len:236 (-) Transcript_20462:150-857(-)